MDRSSVEAGEFNVDESAFWHTNMDLYYGYQLGEVVEVEHEVNKYWMASIEYSYKHLLLLRWVGNYGEFWLDTSIQNTPGCTNDTLLDEYNTPKRIFPPGYHMQSQLKSQFFLERPTKVLITPSLYDPSNDPYANIKTVEDLIALDEEKLKPIDEFGQQDATNLNEPASIVMAKCKTKIAYGQEDQDELEAALQNLNELDSQDDQLSRNESPDSGKNESVNCIDKSSDSQDKLFELKSETKSETETLDSACDVVFNQDQKNTIDDKRIPREDSSSQVDDQIIEKKVLTNDNEMKVTYTSTNELDDLNNLEICKKLQESAYNNGKYLGIGKNNKVYHLKPKQFFDVGGANQERVLVPGTLMEVSHTIETESGLELAHWFAVVLKNLGGRLVLRWFLCDEPKFKQGRLELKSCRSKYVYEDDELTNSDDNRQEEDNTAETRPKLSASGLTFCIHFCNPRIFSVSHAKTIDRSYKLPKKITSLISDSHKYDISESTLTHEQIEHVFDYRRMNLDKDRPIIEHLMSTIRRKTPSYVNISFAPKDKSNKREVLLSTPKNPKLFKGFIKKELEPGVCEVHSDAFNENGDCIKFIYPYEGNYSILPQSWASNNEDCLSVHPSRNPTPLPSDNTIVRSENNTTYPNETNSLNDDQPVKDTTATEKQEISPQSINENGSQKDISNDDASMYEIAKVDVQTIEPTPETNTATITSNDTGRLQQTKRENNCNPQTFICDLDTSSSYLVKLKFRVMDHLEVVHPSSDVTICSGRIRKIVYPLLWIQISADSYTVLPFNSTDIYPSGWCNENGHSLISLLPPRKRFKHSSGQADNKKRKKMKNANESNDCIDYQRTLFDKEHFDLSALNDKQLDIDYITNQKSNYIRIFFNHKCFTGPSLSKGKICSLPQYVGPGPLRLVMEEVLTKVISVAYVPPRILNDLSSKAFEDLLIAKNLTNTTSMEFKAKYQKRVHREDVPVCLNPDDVNAYCECVCEHLKCCYNLFGPNLYDGDDCPGHCRVLTKSNKFMKRATYYREKARLGEYTNDSGANKKTNNSNANKTSRPRYAGRGSSESNSSNVSRCDQVQSRASSADDDAPSHELKENLVAVEEQENEEENNKTNDTLPNIESMEQSSKATESCAQVNRDNESDTERVLTPSDHQLTTGGFVMKIPAKLNYDQEFAMLESDLQPLDWSPEDVAQKLDICHLGMFKSYMISEAVDGHALMLLDKLAIREHFHLAFKHEYSPEEVGRLGRFVEFLKAREQDKSETH